MPSTRSSARGDTNTSPASVKSTAGQKRKAEATSPNDKGNKRGKAIKEQKTIEETIGAEDAQQSDEKKANGNKQTNGSADSHANGAHEEQSNLDSTTQEQGNGASNTKEQSNGKVEKQEANEQDEDVAMENAMEDATKEVEANALDQVKAQENEPGKTTKQTSNEESSTDVLATGDAIEEDKQRESAMPSNILEKGIVYFFTRGRVGTDDPNSVQDLARSYFVLRPLPHGAKITDGSIQDAKISRLLALPKKVWPKSGRDKFMVFVEKAKTDMKSLKEEFFQGSEYSTKTTGTRQTPPVTPIGEGVYAITTTGGGQGATHLAYILTIPSTISEVQTDLGLAEKGSFVLSLKNPESSGPANASLPEKPDWPKEYIEEFSGRSWMPVHPKHLDYANAQLLLIGEDFESSNNLEAKPQDEKDDNKNTPGEELQKLGDEDEHRVEALKGDDSIFADLGLSSKDYPKVMTTW